jgi:hypothetical protein
MKIKYSFFTERVCGFGATYTLPSSQFLECLASKPLGHTWTESELKECCEELGITNDFCNKYEHESLSSDCSNGQCHSETSLGEQIIAMTRDPQPPKLSCIPSHELGLASKPLSSDYSTQVNDCLEKLIHSRDKYLDNNISADTILFGKFNHVRSLTDRSQYLSESTYSQKKHVFISSEPDGDNRHTYSMKMLDSPNESEVLQGNSISVGLEDIITQKCSDLRNEIPMNTQYSSQHRQEGQSFNGQCQNMVEVKHCCSQNSTSLNSTSNAVDVSSHIGDIKVQQWFPDLVCKYSRVPDSHIYENESETDLHVKNLARDCSDNCEVVSIGPTCENDINTVYSGKPRGEELNLECLVQGGIDECGGSSSIKGNGIDKKWSVSNSHVNVQKQGELSHLEQKTENNSLNPGQKPGDETDCELLEKVSAHGGFEG